MSDKYKVDSPIGKSNNWSIEQFEVTEDQAAIERIRSMFNGGRGVPAGKYTALKRNGQIIMSDTPNEIWDLLSIIRNAKEHVLINGLGLGMVLKACLNNEKVTHVTVIENSLDVIYLVGEYFEDKYSDKLIIVFGDAFNYKPPVNVRYGAVWHDIWDNICTDNLLGMHKLHRKYGKRTNWQGSWCRDLCEKYAKQDKMNGFD